MLTAGAFSLALLIAAQPPASEMKTAAITLTGEALGLVPGTSVNLQIGAQRVFIDTHLARSTGPAREGLNVLPDEAITATSVAPERYSWVFVVPSDGIVPSKEMTFQVPIPDVGPSAHHLEKIFIAVQYTITLPARGKEPARTISRSSQYSAPVSKFKRGRCFRLQGFDDGSFTIGVVDCDERMKHPSEGMASGN